MASRHCSRACTRRWTRCSSRTRSFSSTTAAATAPRPGGGSGRIYQLRAFRRYASMAMNLLRERITRIRMTDQGCMLRAYSRDIVDAINGCREINTYIPARAYTCAPRPVEIEVGHEERAAGVSKYSLYQLIRLNFDLVTAFSLVPLLLVWG